MNLKYIKKPTQYDGSQLRAHWILENFSLESDSIVSFCGGCDVSAHMVDLEDVLKKDFIFSENMLHFIIEHFDSDLEKAIYRQRLFVSLLHQELINVTKNKFHFERKGDDIYFKNYKMTVSIATSSPVSTLIHTGINIISKNTPVPTKGLADFKINPEKFALSVMKKYVEELEEIKWARSKVKAVK